MKWKLLWLHERNIQYWKHWVSVREQQQTFLSDYSGERSQNFLCKWTVVATEQDSVPASQLFLARVNNFTCGYKPKCKAINFLRKPSVFLLPWLWGSHCTRALHWNAWCLEALRCSRSIKGSFIAPVAMQSMRLESWQGVGAGSSPTNDRSSYIYFLPRLSIEI